VDDGEISNDNCPHSSPSDTADFCRVCFILNVHEHLSPDDSEIELSDKQIKAVYFLHAKHMDGEKIDWEDFDEL